MDGLGENAFPGAAFALQQDGGVIGFGGLARDFQHAAGGVVQGNDLAEIVTSAGEFHIVTHAHPQGQHFAGAVQGGDHVGEMEGLDQVVVSAQLHGFNGAIHHVVGAHH